MSKLKRLEVENDILKRALYEIASEIRYGDNPIEWIEFYIRILVTNRESVPYVPFDVYDLNITDLPNEKKEEVRLDEFLGENVDILDCYEIGKDNQIVRKTLIGVEK